MNFTSFAWWVTVVLNARGARWKKMQFGTKYTIYKITIASPVYRIMHFYSLQFSQGGCLQSTGKVFLQFYRISLKLLQSTNVQNRVITVYEKSIAPPLYMLCIHYRGGSLLEILNYLPDGGHFSPVPM